MARYVEFSMADGSTILVETVEEVIDPVAIPKGGPFEERMQDTVSRVNATFDDAVDTVRQSAQVLIQKVRSLADPPDEVEISFGLKVAGEVGNFAVARASADANYTVTLTWKREQADRSGKREGP